ncbi:MAG: cupin domain-containing protein [Chloroflexota bacterium]|nr:cupin domain-containing protein [Chloroflexota bacterium]
MPYVAETEALDHAFMDLERLADELDAPPSRLCLVGTSGLRVILLHWPPGFATVPHLHPGAEEIFRVIRGRAAFTIGDEPEREVGPGELVIARRGVRHAIRVPEGGSLVLLAAVAPNEDRPDEQIELP